MRTMGFRRGGKLHSDLTGSANEEANIPDKTSDTVQHDLPDVEQCVEEEKSLEEHSSAAGKPDRRQEEAAVELAIEKLPES